MTNESVIVRIFFREIGNAGAHPALDEIVFIEISAPG
jgi:hypothetical protein